MNTKHKDLLKLGAFLGFMGFGRLAFAADTPVLSFKYPMHPWLPISQTIPLDPNDKVSLALYNDKDDAQQKIGSFTDVHRSRETIGGNVSAVLTPFKHFKLGISGDFQRGKGDFSGKGIALGTHNEDKWLLSIYPQATVPLEKGTYLVLSGNIDFGKTAYKFNLGELVQNEGIEQRGVGIDGTVYKMLGQGTTIGLGVQGGTDYYDRTVKDQTLNLGGKSIPIDTSKFPVIATEDSFYGGHLNASARIGGKSSLDMELAYLSRRIKVRDGPAGFDDVQSNVFGAGLGLTTGGWRLESYASIPTGGFSGNNVRVELKTPGHVSVFAEYHKMKGIDPGHVNNEEVNTKGCKVGIKFGVR